MEDHSHRVTPEGVRDGDPGALRGLVERRGGAVLAFCEAVCEPGDALLAAGEAFARFRAAVSAWDDPAGLNPEVLLLGATRHAAASMARTASTSGVRRGRFGRQHDDSAMCAEVPSLLAARADGILAPDELDALSAHLEAHPACANVEAAFRRAERAYRSPPAGGLSPVAADALVATLAGAEPPAPAESGLPRSFDGPESLEEPEAPDDAIDPGPALADPLAAEPADLDEPAPDEQALPPHVDVEPEPFEVDPDDAEFEIEPDEFDPEPEDEPEPPRHAEPATAVLAAVPARAAEHRTGLPRTPRMHLHVPHVDHGPVFRYVLPAAAVTVALIIILAVAGVLGGDGPAPGALLVPIA